MTQRGSLIACWYVLGMHEIAGALLLVVEQEQLAFRRVEKTHHDLRTKCEKVGIEDKCCNKEDEEVQSRWLFGDGSDNSGRSSDSYTEMHTYLLFCAVMRDLRVAYTSDPPALPPTGPLDCGESSDSESGKRGSREGLTLGKFLEYLQGNSGRRVDILCSGVTKLSVASVLCACRCCAEGSAPQALGALEGSEWLR